MEATITSQADYTANRSAASYYRLADARYEAGIDMLDRMHFVGSETVIDAECGTGRITEAILGRVPRGRVFAIDRSIDMVRAVRANLRGVRGSHRVVCMQGDLEMLNVGQVVDCVFSNYVIQPTSDDVATYASFAHSLRVGGTLAVQFPTVATGRSPILTAVARVRRRVPFARYVGDYAELPCHRDEQRVRALLADAGFTLTECWHTRCCISAVTLADVKIWLGAIPLRGYLRHIPDRRVTAAFVDEVLAKLGDHLVSALCVPYDAIGMLARRCVPLH